jgi:creatinine amidohydrolase
LCGPFSFAGVTMRLDQATWLEVEAYLRHSDGIILPVGSTEQHGPMGVIGTDAICASVIAERVGAVVGAYVAPTLAITPAPFNMGFPGTMSISEPLFQAMVSEIFAGFAAQGFGHVYVLNGHGANLAPLRAAAVRGERIRSWWDFEAVNVFRTARYGAWEGMHATPSEVAITQAVGRVIAAGAAVEPPEMLSAAFITAHAGDKHGPADAHRAAFPDGRVGSHSALARPEDGVALLRLATEAIAVDFTAFIS